jgi:hemolysin activation/secretion protein
MLYQNFIEQDGYWFTANQLNSYSEFKKKFKLEGTEDYKKGTLLIGAKSGYISGQTIFSNELFRIGGLQSFRGFDDESIFASFYAISNIEYRFLMDKNSNIFLFASRTYLENISANKRIIDRPLSFGSGISFETKAGIFNLTYALGKQLNNPIILRAAKIHFGIVSLF